MAEHLLVTFMVTRDGEPGHPMDTIVKKIDVDPGGAAEDVSIGRLVESVRREVSRKAALAFAPYRPGVSGE